MMQLPLDQHPSFTRRSKLRPSGKPGGFFSSGERGFGHVVIERVADLLENAKDWLSSKLNLPE